jgi:hypothetical protein
MIRKRNLNPRPQFYWISFMLLLVVQFACNLQGSSSKPDTAATLNGLYTASALTVAAHLGVTVTPGVPQPTAFGSITPGYGTYTPVTQISKCDAAVFVRDVTYPDGSVLSRGEDFTKTWRLKNNGTCSWTTSYRLVFVSGEEMNGPASIPLSVNVPPGNTVDLSVNLEAPSNDGKYRGYWKLRNSSNALFGIGTQADTAFWVDIKVAGPSHIAYDFAANYCSADWENNNTALPCPGEEGDDKGYVIRLNHPKFENGSSQDQAGLLAVPRDSNNGLIRGKFPAFTVKSGDRFRAQVYCRYQAVKCNVIFRLDYLNNGQVRTLGSWNEAYEGKYYPVDVNLGSLAGETLKFILVVTANGSPKDDEAIWLNPHILRQGNAPAPTKTFTPTLTNTATASATFTPTIPAPTLTPTETYTPTP